MDSNFRIKHKWIGFLLALVLFTSACTTARPTYIVPAAQQTEEAELPTSTPFPARPVYAPGTLVDYIAQSGDTLHLLSVRFGATVQEILWANPEIPESTATLPPGFPMKMPIYYKPLWGTAYQIIPDSAFVYGPDLIGFDLRAFVESSPGWYKQYGSYIQAEYKDAADLLQWLGENYSINPRLLLALLEYRAQALSNPTRDRSAELTLIMPEDVYTGVYLQLSHSADLLNDGYYRYRQGELTSITHLNGEIENIDPWQNAGTVALQYFFSLFLDGEEYKRAIGPDGFAKTYREMFGDPWQGNTTVLPGSLTQPQFILPFRMGTTWSYTGGPHTGWGNLKPYAAIDLAPPVGSKGCVGTNEVAVAVADGVIVRTGPGTAVLDLDGDGDERTGWNIFYLHIAQEGRVALGTHVKQGDPIGHPSCEGGQATGTHLHIARKYNGEWISATGFLPFNMDGWTPVEGSRAYLGQLVRGDEVVTASVDSPSSSMITRK
ncbi:MAG TPA: LysM peptidoglycan-binding domain-containing M23 family metallopeptidase [Anaerolineaceae bacterium]|nr:peptidoglycan DD-metalloendopeptidase family protein [Anaerolineaceae bacterium]HOT25903.1 LysM peptidoglycan-binding domain-containing M23 family metallopeptidase [Anaerolineaceae bacterium]HQH58052.1 LysM peptidoglycan-binding domain-containing M23 family metallopeptidase [Anaerolineaceae bacterium]